MSRSSRAWLAYAVAGTLLLAGAYLCFELGRYEAGYSIIDHRRDIAALDEQVAKQRATADELRRQIAIFQTSVESTRRRTRRSRRTSPTSRRRFSPRKRSSWSTAASSRRTMGSRAYGSRASRFAGGRRASLRGPARAGSGNRSQSARDGHGKVAARGRAGWTHDVVGHGGSRTRQGEL